MARGNIILLAACCLCFGEICPALSSEGYPSPELLDKVGGAIWNCMSGKLAQAIEGASSGANNSNCWYSERYRSCLSANLSASPASQVVNFNNEVYPQACEAQQVTTNKCVSSAMSEVNNYGCEVKVKEVLKKVQVSQHMKEAYCRASMTAHDCILSVVKYCSVTEGPKIIDNLSMFSKVRSACSPHIPVTTTPATDSDIGGIGDIGDLFPDLAVSDNNTASQTSNQALSLRACAAAISGFVLLFVVVL